MDPTTTVLLTAIAALTDGFNLGHAVALVEEELGPDAEPEEIYPIAAAMADADATDLPEGCQAVWRYGFNLGKASHLATTFEGADVPADVLVPKIWDLTDVLVSTDA
jgi:hypothetical protein